MKLRTTYAGILPLVLISCGGGSPEQQTSESQTPIIRGQDESGLDQVVLIQAQRTSGFTRCSGTYIAPRVVLTAAHCIKSNTLKNGVFVYYGKDYATDVAMLPNIPAPGQTSPWAQVETWLLNPNYISSVNYPDLAILYLDRQLPFAPMPLLTDRVGPNYIGQQATIAGWGANEALDANITQVLGVGVKRSGHATIVGSPTAADYHADDPNPGILDPKIQRDLLKLDGHAPSSNPCAGDSGGPVIIRKHGQNYLAGVNFWTGLFCEEYSIYTRIEPFLGFIADAVRNAGRGNIRPILQCVGGNSDGSLTAYFGYQNDNGLTVDIPFGWNNAFLPVKAGAKRPSSFGPGQHSWVFDVDFAAGQKLLYELRAPFSPPTLLRVDKNSPRCTKGDTGFVCAAQCRATLAAPCPGNTTPFEQCASDCLGSYDAFPGCETEWGAYLQCTGGLSPDASNWTCDPDFPPQPTQCTDTLNAALSCEGYI